MLTIVAVILALTVIPSPWGWVTVIAAGLIDIAETAFFVRWSKRRRATVGVETFVGRHATVVRALTPLGQVKIDGEVWEARAAHDLLPGDEVVVRAVDGLLLEVEPRT
jgi:membrane protein implicated in regulation of membrane protease activity